MLKTLSRLQLPMKYLNFAEYKITVISLAVS